jgi:hypothetical protein
MAARQQLDFIRVPQSKGIQCAVLLRSSDEAKTDARAIGQEGQLYSISISAEDKELSEESCWGVRLRQYGGT